MLLQIFDVEHGACALLTADNGMRLMADCGHNASTGWRPGQYLLAQGVTSLEMLAITNYDEDHASGGPDLFDRVHVQLACIEYARRLVGHERIEPLHIDKKSASAR